MNFKLTFICAFGDELVLQLNHIIQHESRQHNTRLLTYHQKRKNWHPYGMSLNPPVFIRKNKINSVTKTSTGNPMSLIYTKVQCDLHAAASNYVEHYLHI